MDDNRNGKNRHAASRPDENREPIVKSLSGDDVAELQALVRSRRLYRQFMWPIYQGLIGALILMVLNNWTGFLTWVRNLLFGGHAP